MNRALPLLSLLLALVALAAAVMPRGPVELPPPPDAARPAPDDGELRRRIELLEEDSSRLWTRLVALERRTQQVSSDGGVTAPGLASEVAQLREEVRAAMAGQLLSQPTSRTALKDLLVEAQAEQRAEGRKQFQQRMQERAAAVKEKWKRFASSSGLSWAQEQELNRRLAVEDTRRQALVSSGQGAPGPDAFREYRDERSATDQAIMPQLTESQRKEYEALRREEQGGGRDTRRAPAD